MRGGVLVLLLGVPALLSGQAPGKFPPDSLLNLKVIPHGTPPVQVIGMMRNITSALGVRCQHCHVGREGQPLAEFDFASDEKRTKLVARQMMRMLQEVNRRLDSIPELEGSAVEVTCATCHRGLPRPVTLAELMVETAMSAGADSAIKAYRALRTRHYGRDAYDFGEPSLNVAAFRLGRAQKYDEAFALLKLNEEMFPQGANMFVFRGNIQLMRGDTTAAAAAFREALRRDPRAGEARSRLRDIGQTP